MKYKLIITLYALLSWFPILDAQNIQIKSKGIKYARFANIEDIDKCQYKCIYQYKVIDKTLKQNKEYFDILQIGNNYSKYFGYPVYRIDSVVYKKDINKISLKEATEIYKNFDRRDASSYTVIKNNKDKNLKCYDRVFTDYYVYEDTPIFNWKILKEKKTICGYICQRAMTSFRGREWTAYYAIDIPKSDGPWKFSGLPGLIMQVSDKTGEHFFSAISIGNSKDNIYEKEREYFKTSRQQFNKQLQNFKNNARNVISGSQLAPRDPKTGKELEVPKRKMFYNPIELE